MYDIGKIVKNVASFIFKLNLIVGFVSIIIGIFSTLIAMADGYSFSQWFACTAMDVLMDEDLFGLYWSKKLLFLGFICCISSLSMLPLIAFGELVHLVKNIHETLTQHSTANTTSKDTKPLSIPRVESTTSKNIHNWRCNNCDAWITKSPCPYCGSEK